MGRKYFGTDGVRGRVGQMPVTPDFIMRLGYAAGATLVAREGLRANERPAVLIGKDTRISGYMLEAALEAGFSAAGVDVCLDGDFSDHLDAHPRDALSDTLRFGRWRVLASEAKRIRRDYGLTVLATHPAWRRLAARTLGRVRNLPPLLDVLRSDRRARLFDRLRAELTEFRDFPRPEQAYYCLRVYPAFGAGREQYYAQRHRLEHRSPFHDPGLVQWMLSLPADVSYRQGRTKWPFFSRIPCKPLRPCLLYTSDAADE